MVVLSAGATPYRVSNKQRTRLVGPVPAMDPMLTEGWEVPGASKMDTGALTPCVVNAVTAACKVVKLVEPLPAGSTV